MNIGLAIKKIRTGKGISQGKLAKECDISQTSLSQIEGGIKRPSSKTLNSISNALNVPETIFYIYGMEESDVPENKRQVYEILYPTVEDMIKKMLIG